MSSDPLPTGKKSIALILSAYAMRFLGQGIAFLLFARVLGSQGFGVVVTALTVYSPLSPLVDIGAYSIVARDISLGRPPEKVISENLTIMVFALPIALLIASLFIHFTNPNYNLLTLVAIGIGYLCLSRISMLLSAIQNSFSNRVPVLQIETFSAFLLISLGIFGLLSGYTPELWALLYGATGILVSLSGILAIKKHVHGVGFTAFPSYPRIREGVIFSLGGTFQYTYTDIDKIILSHFATSHLMGIAGMASRLMSIALVPIGSVYSIYYPRIMRASYAGMNELRRLLLRVLGIAAAYSVLVFLAIYLLSAYIPDILGKDYTDVVRVIKLLTLSIVLQVFQTPFADAITGMGYQSYRTTVQGITCLVAAALGAYLIPLKLIDGVIIMSIATHAFIFIAYFLGYLKISQLVSAREMSSGAK